jgi:hypothetical protein
MDDAGGVCVSERVSDLFADLGHSLPGQAALPGDLRAERGPETNCMTIHGTPSCSTTS